MKKLFLITTFFTILIFTPHHVYGEKMVHVKLVNYINNTDELSIRVKGKYFTLSPILSIEEGVNYTLKVKRGEFSLREENGKEYNIINELWLIPENIDEKHLVYINERPYQGAFQFIVENKKYIRPINQLPLEVYLKGVVPFEVYPSWHLEALKAQSLAARTYAIIQSSGGTIMDDSIRFQVYGGFSSYERTNRAVEETKGEIVTYNGKPISTFYSASNGGMTESNQNVWGGEKQVYYPIKEDPYDPQNPWTLKVHQTQISVDDLIWDAPNNWQNAKEKDVEICNTIRSWLSRKGFMNPIILSIDHFSINKEKSESSRSTRGSITITFAHRPLMDMLFFDQIVLKDVPLSHIRPMLGGTKFKSYLIDSLTKENGVYTLKGRGYGHGVGMSQWGANQMAEQGFTYKQIIQFYYPNTEIHVLEK
jgi:stage II sporulation protein D